MPSRQAVHTFLAQRHLAFVGVSHNTKEFANTVYRRLRDDGRVMYPVNGKADVDTIEGDRCFATLAEVPDPVDGVVVMVRPDAAAAVVRDAVTRGIPRVWLYRGVGPGADSDEAVRLCRDNRVEVVDGACPLMFDEPVRGVHKLHRMISRRRFAA